MANLVPDHRSSLDAVHPRIYVAIVALTIWFVGSVWFWFGAKSYESVTAAMVTFLFFMAIIIPTAIWMTWRRHPEARADASDSDQAANGKAESSFRDWASSDFGTWTGRQKAWQAAVEILLPIVAVAFGITAFGLAYYLTSVSA